MSDSNSAPSAVSTLETPQISSTTFSRGNLILLVLLLIQLALTIYLFWPSDNVRVTGEPLLANVTTSTVTALTITDDGDRSVNFVKEGDLWTLADTGGYPAREEKITQTLDKLTAISTDRLVTQTSGSHDRLQVAENNYLRKVDVTTAQGTQTLYIGSTSGVSAVHVRAATSDATYLTSEIASWELDTLTTSWIDVAYHKVLKEQIDEVTLENAHGSFTFVRATEPQAAGTEIEWTLADATPDEPVASANINTLLDRITTLNLQSVLGTEELPEYGLDAPLATLTVTSSEATTATTPSQSKTTTLVIGAKDDETNTYVLKSSESEFYVRLAAFTGDEFVNKQRSDFMVNEPDAAASTEPSVEASTVATTTGALDESPAITASITDTVSNTATTTATGTATGTVDATSITTDTVDEAADEAEPNATPTN